MHRIGLYGGTFDPLHNGHTAIVRAVLQQHRIGRLIVMPCWLSPHKLESTQIPASPQDRFAMLQAVFGGQDRIEISRFELDQNSPSYTYLTIRHFQERCPDQRIVLIVGWDQYQTIETWKQFSDWSSEIELLVFRRKGQQNERRQVPMRVRFGTAEIPEISATQVRERLLRGLSVNDLVPTPVEDYIRLHHLYR